MRSLIIKLRSIRWMVHVACLAESKVLCETVFGDLYIKKRIILKMILRRYGVRM
jgi:hypothetical protein